MKKLSFIFVTVLFILVAFQDITTQEVKDDVVFKEEPTPERYITDKNDFEKMSFEMELNKTEYILLEPIAIKFKFSNKTDQPQTSYTPNWFTETSVKISYNDESQERALYNISTGGVRFPRIFMTGKTIEDPGILQPNYVNKFFAEPGKYQLQFFLSGGEGLERISSSVFEVEIKQPTGIDKKAFDYLMKYQSESEGDLFYWTKQDGKRNLARLETFVARYSSSVYGDYAIYSLGNFYLFYNELDKAKIEFEKIKSSSNRIIANGATKALADIEEKFRERLTQLQ